MTKKDDRPKPKILSRDPPDECPPTYYTKEDHPDAGRTAD